MARYFRFSTADLLQQAARDLRTSIELESDLSPLFTPATVDGRRVGNRFAIQPMEGCDGTNEGRPDHLTFRRFERFGAGGAKLVWGEAAAILPTARANPRQLVMDPRFLPEFAELVSRCRAAHRQHVGDDGDLLLGIQLTHSGRYSFEQPVRAFHCPLLDGAMDRPNLPPLLKDEELERLSDDFLAAARVARDAGFDFIDIKQCHRYLLGELLAAVDRPGPYGGPLENRLKFVLALFRRLRAELPDLILATRINVHDGVPYQAGPDGQGVAVPIDERFAGFGNDRNAPQQPNLAEPIAAIDQMRQAGVSLVNVSMGCPYFNPHVLRPAEVPAVDGYLPPENPLLGVDRHFRAAAMVHAAIPGLPIVGSGYSYLQEFLYQAGAANARAGRVTFVGIGRASLAYPDAARDLEQMGRLDRKRICRTFSYCTNLMRAKDHPLGQYPTGCPPFDREVYHDLYEEVKRQRQKP